MPQTTRAVVFSGGGSKGGYQIGAWKALRELEYRPNIVTGTSVGALNGALMAMDRFDEAVHIWETMDMARVFGSTDDKAGGATPTFSLRFLRDSVLQGGADYSPLRDLVFGMMDEPALRASPIRFGLVTTMLPKVRPVEVFVEDIPPGMVADYIIASAAAFPVMKSHKIGDITYVDGGYSDNMPINMAIRAGAEEIVALNIGGMPSSGLHGENAVVHYVHSKKPLNETFGGIFMFDREIAQQHFRRGYLDTYKHFGKLDGYYYAFEMHEKHQFAQHESASSVLFERTFSALPGVSFLEKNGRNAVINFLRGYNDRLFEGNSNVLYCAECAGEVLQINPQEIYTADSFTAAILQAAKELLDSDTFHEKFDSLTTALDEGLSVKLVRSVLDALDKRLLTGVCIAYLRNHNITPAQKRRLWLVAMLLPEIYCAALFCCAASTTQGGLLQDENHRS